MIQLRSVCWLATRARRFHRDESGQVTILFLFAGIAAVVLFGFMLDTAQQTSRKVELQGAADAGAMAGGIWMARGLNLMAMDNKGMADILSVMLVVHAVGPTNTVAQTIIAGMESAAAGGDVASLGTATPETLAIEDQLEEESLFWYGLADSMQTVDQELSDPDSGIGWQMMRSLDELNQRIKTTFPTIAGLQAAQYANKNGADQVPFALLRSSAGSPAFPVARGSKDLIIDETQNCMLPQAEQYALSGIETACTEYTLFPCISPAAVYIPFAGYINANKSNMPWPRDPPLPMVLSDSPGPEGNATISDGSTVDYSVVHDDLEFLAIALGKVRPSAVGGGRFDFKNPGAMGITYGQTEVYNPSDWSLFSQNWRAKLSKATLLSNTNAMEGIPQLSGGLIDFTFVNTH